MLRGWTVVASHIGLGHQDIPLHLCCQAGGKDGEAHCQEGCRDIRDVVGNMVWCGLQTGIPPDRIPHGTLLVILTV